MDARRRRPPACRPASSKRLQADAVVLALGQDTDSGFLRRRARHRVQARRHGDRRAGHDDRRRRRLRRRRHGAERAHRHRRGRPWQAGRAPHRRLAARTAHVPAGKPPLVDFADAATCRCSATPSRRRRRVCRAATATTGFAEVVAGLSEQEARREAQRCLSCGNCFECDNCFAACPEQAIEKLGPGRGYRSTFGICTGCATCFEQCPCHAIEMQAEACDGADNGSATMDGNTAVAHVAYRTTEVCAIFPITPSLDHGGTRRRVGRPRALTEHLGQRARRAGDAKRRRCRRRRARRAAGRRHDHHVHGIAGTLLMLPNMYKIAGELTAHGVPCRRAGARHPGAVDLRRPHRCHGRARHRFSPCCPRVRCRRRTISRWWRKSRRSPRACRSCISSTASAPATK